MLEQLRDLRNRFGHESSAVVSGDSGPLVDKLRAEQIPTKAQDFGFSGLHDLVRMPWKILTLASHFRRKRIDVVQTHLFNSMVIGRLAAWLADVPVRLAMVASPFHLEAYSPRWIDRATCWMDTGLIGSCQLTVDLYRGMGVADDKLALVYYGADEQKFSVEATPPADIRAEYGWPESTPIVAMVAYFYPPLPQSRWIPEAVQGRAIKGHEYVIEAVPAILREFPMAKVLLVGSGWGEAGASYMEQMQALVRERGLEDAVIFTGFRTDVNNVLRAADVAVQASLCENLGGTIESLLMACPTVATRVGGMVDTVVDGRTGLAVEPRDPAALAEGVLRLLREREYAQSLGRAGRQWMLERFTLRHTVNNLEQLYQRQILCGQHRRSGYRLWVSCWRLLILCPLFVYLGMRLALCDYGLAASWYQQLRCRVLNKFFYLRAVSGRIRYLLLRGI